MVLWVEHALRRCPKPVIPTPYIPYSYIPLSAELVVWLWFLRLTSLLIAFLVAMQDTHRSRFLFLYAAMAVLLALGYCLSPPGPQRRLLSAVLWVLARAGYNAQTIHNSLEIARAADIFDFVSIVVLVSVIVRFTRSDPRKFIYPLTSRRAPYIANRASQISYITFSARRSPAIYFGLPVLLFVILVIHSFIEQRADVRRRAAMGADPNSHNPAARIPPEVQLRIFHLVRTLRRFSECDTPVPQGAIYLRELQPLGRWTGLAAGCSVCRAWRDAATEVLYSDVFLPNSSCVLAFATCLDVYPELAQLVRRIALPVADPISSHAIERIVRSCCAAVDLAFFDADTDVFDIPGFALNVQRVHRLAVTWGHRVLDVDDADYSPRQCDVLGMLERLPSLDQLSLCAVRIPWNDSDRMSASDLFSCTRFNGIRTIRLDACMIHISALLQLMLALPNLRTAALRNMVVHNTERLSASSVFVRQLNTLEELDVSSTHVRFASAPIRLKSIGEFTALRVLALDAHALQHVRVLPPVLERLVLSFAPYSTHLRITRRQRVFLTVDRIRRLGAPSLRTVQIWDEVSLAHMHDWKIAAFMLREMLGIEVEVNLFLEWDEQLWWRFRLSTQNALRWLYDP